MGDHALLEREDLLELLKGHAAAASRGEGRLVFVGGEAGVGKSALVETFRRRHSGDAVVLTGACEAMTAPQPLGPVLDFATELDDGFARLVEADPAPRRLFTALLDRLRAGQRPRLLIVEDVHWADDATLDLLRYLGRRVGDAVIRYAPEAGRLALRLGAYREAREQFARSLRHAGRLDPEERATLLELHATACGYTGHNEEAAASRRAAADLLAGPEHAERRARLLSQLTWTLCSMLRDDEAEHTLAEASTALEGRPGSPVQAYIYFLRGWRSYARGETGLRLAREAEERARRGSNPHVLVRAKTIAAMALGANERVAAARHELAGAVALATGPDADLAVVGHDQVASALLETFRCRQAEVLLDRAEDLARRGGFEGLLHPTFALRALTHLRMGRWSEAEAAATWVLERPHQSPTALVWATLVRVLLRVRLGDHDPGEALERLEEHARSSPRLAVVVAMRAALAEAALARGDHQAALAEARHAYDRAREEGSAWHVAQLAYWVWKAGGDPRLPAHARGPFALQVRGRARQAARRWARLGCPYERAAALAESDDVEDLLEARRSFEELGARPALADVTRRLRSRGVRGIPRGPQPSTRAHPLGLTHRERQVLELVAAGLRNAEIARRNRVSTRTVDHQVSAVLAKLGVRSRAEAIAEAYRLGLVDVPPKGR